MAVTAWTYPASEAITGSTKISDTDNKITNAMGDLAAWLNGTGVYSGSGFTYESNTQLTTNQATFDAAMVTWQSEIDAAPLINVVNYIDMNTILSMVDITSITYDGDDNPTLITYTGGWTVAASYVASGNGQGEVEQVIFKQSTTEIYRVDYTYGANNRLATQTVTENGSLTQQQKHDLMTVPV